MFESPRSERCREFLASAFESSTQRFSGRIDHAEKNWTYVSSVCIYRGQRGSYGQDQDRYRRCYKPYNYKDAAGNLVGFEVDLAAELCKRMKIECEIVEQAWDGIIPSLVAKKYDAIMAGMSIKAKREKVISFSRHYAATPIRFACPKVQTSSYQSKLENVSLGEVSGDEKAALDDLMGALKGKTVGVQASTTHEDFMNEFMPDIDLKSYDTMDNMILDLRAGRIDAGYTAVTFLKPIIDESGDVVSIGPNMTGGPWAEVLLWVSAKKTLRCATSLLQRSTP